MERQSKSYPAKPAALKAFTGPRLGKALNDSPAKTIENPDQQCGLLISIRNADEARLIGDLPIEVLDLKEPDRGPLAACDPDVWQEALDRVRFAGKWSVALGESDDAVRLASHVPEDAAFAKAGPSGLPKAAELTSVWRTLRKLLPQTTELVAVAYADHQLARSLSVESILELAIEEGLSTLLIDTFVKGEINSLGWIGHNRLHAIVEHAAENGVDVVLAGGLSLEDLPRLCGIRLNRIALRGAVCSGGREGIVQRDKVNEWLNALKDGTIQAVPQSSPLSSPLSATLNSVRAGTDASESGSD